MWPLHLYKQMIGKTLKNKDLPPNGMYVQILCGFTMISFPLQMTFSCDFLAESFMEEKTWWKRVDNADTHKLWGNQ